MNAIKIEPQHAASSCWGEDLLGQCVVSEMRAMNALEGAQMLGEIVVGSCTISFLSDPAVPGRKVILVQASSGDFAMIPSELFSPIR